MDSSKRSDSSRTKAIRCNLTEHYERFELKELRERGHVTASK